jgi:hypothetical protein
LTEKTAPRGFKSITDVMYELIRKGRASEARDFYAEMGAEIPNWRYGAGGGIGLFRNPVVRMMTMFYRWPINNAMFHAWLMMPKNGLVRKEFQIFASCAVLAFAAGALGLSKNVAKWIGMGPTPEEIGFGGPIYDDVSKLWTALAGLAEVGQAALVASPEEREKVMKRSKRNWDAWMK